jgi:vitamin B12 transporter
MKLLLPTPGSARRLLVILASGALPAVGYTQVVAPAAPAQPAAHATSANPTETVQLRPMSYTLPPVFITATRTARPQVEIGSATALVTPEDLSRSQQDSLAAALGGTPGAPLFTSGGSGATSSLFLRGANSNQTLFLVDGIRLSDANADYSVFLGGAAFGAGDTVEVVRGPQSTLYGGEAIGGLVSIATEPAGSAPEQGLSFSGGSHGTSRGAYFTRGLRGAWDYSLSLAGGHTANDRPNNTFTDANVAGRLARKVSNQLNVGTTVRWFHGKYGDPGDRFANDPDDSTREDNLLVTVFARAFPIPHWQVRGTVGGQDRRFVIESAFPSVTTNRRGVFDLQATYTGNTRHHVTLGTTAEATHTRNTGFGNINERQRSLAFFAQDEFHPTNALSLTAGLRSDDFDTFGRATTGRLTAAWQVVPQKAKLRASYGTGFRSPSFLDLYGRSPFYVGNPGLKPEHARGWDAGLDLYGLPRGVTGSLTWFDNRYTDLIAGDFTKFPSNVANVARARTRGIEASAKVILVDNWEARASYTYLDAHNLTAGTRLLRRPRHSGSADLWHDFGGGLSAGAGLTYAADRRDIDAQTFLTITGENYTVARVYGAYELRSGLTLKIRVENLLNEQYEPVNGYPAPGFGAFGGVEWRF